MMAKALIPDFTCILCQETWNAVMQLRLDKEKSIFTSVVFFTIGFVSMMNDKNALKMLKLKM